MQDNRIKQLEKELADNFINTAGALQILGYSSAVSITKYIQSGDIRHIKIKQSDDRTVKMLVTKDVESLGLKIYKRKSDKKVDIVKYHKGIKERREAKIKVKENAVIKNKERVEERRKHWEKLAKIEHEAMLERKGMTQKQYDAQEAKWKKERKIADKIKEENIRIMREEKKREIEEDKMNQG
jgi:hypothetical protein